MKRKYKKKHTGKNRLKNFKKEGVVISNVSIIQKSDQIKAEN